MNSLKKKLRESGVPEKQPTRFCPIVSERSSEDLNMASKGPREQLRTFQYSCLLFLMLQMTEEMNRSWTADLGGVCWLGSKKVIFPKVT